MSLHPNVTIALLLLAPILMLTTAALAWRKRSVPGGIELLFLLASLALWGSLSGAGKFSSDLELRLWMLELQFIGIIGVAPSLLCVALASRGLRTHTRPLGMALLGIPALCFLTLVFTTEHNGLFWSKASIDTAGALPVMALTPGPAFWLHAAWSYLVIAIAVGLLIEKWRRRWSCYLSEALPVLASIAIAMACNVAFLASMNSSPQPDWTPVAFAAPALALAWS